MGLMNDQRRWQMAFVAMGLLWGILIFLHLYCFSYASMDSWCYFAPAAQAEAPLRIITPFLGDFAGANTGWGLHWPGGPLFASLWTPFLPRHPATGILMFISFWLALAVIAAVLVQDLTHSRAAAFVGFLLVLGNHMAFNIAWLQRYELLGGAMACLGALLLAEPDRWPAWRRGLLGLVFFALPLLHPVFSGLAGGWLVCLLLVCLMTRRFWADLWVAGAGYIGGWVTFLAYYTLQPAQWARFRDHAAVGFELTRTTAPPGISKFFRYLWRFDEPMRAGSFIFGAALIAGGLLVWAGWRARAKSDEFIVRERLPLFLAAGLVGSLLLIQSTYNGYYWMTAWPFAVILACAGIYRWSAALRLVRPRLFVVAVTGFLLVHSAFFAVRTLKWVQSHGVNYRAEAETFLASLPPDKRWFLPESLWDIPSLRDREVRMNTIPYNCGPEMRRQYDARLQAETQKGDVIVVDALQSHPIAWPVTAGWKEIARRKIVWPGAGGARGYDLTAYQKP